MLSEAKSLFPASSPQAEVFDWPALLGVLRDAGAAIHRLGPDTSLRDALQLIADTAVRLISSDPCDHASAVIYTYDAARGAFDPESRVSSGEAVPLVGDTPRPNGVGALALARRTRVLSYEERTIAFHPIKYFAGIRTAACYPLLVAGQPVGALYIDLRSDRRFTDAELLLLDTFVSLAAVAVYNTRQYEGMTRALQRRVDELERVQQAGQMISSRSSLDETLREILRAALNLTGAEHGSFRLLDKRANVLRLRAAAGEGDSPSGAGEALPVDDHSSVMGWVAYHRRAARIDDLRNPPWSDIYRPLHPAREMRSELAVPLLGSDQSLEGVLNVESPRPSAFDADAQRVLEALATQAVIALQEAKLLEAIEEATEQLVTRSPDELFALLIERACDLLNAPHGAVWEIDSTLPSTLVLRAATGDFPPRYRVPVEGSLLGAAVLSRRPVVSADLDNDARVLRPELVRQMGWVSALIVPLVVRNGPPRGAFGVYTTTPRTFSDWDTRLLTCLANHAALALQQAEALAQIKLAEERQAVAETFAVLGDVSANLLHRINNLIGLIPARIQGIAEKRPALLDDAYTASVLRDVEESAREAMQAARETMVHLRPLRLQPTPVIAGYHAAAARLALPPNIRLLAEGLEALPPVLAGKEQLEFVLFNLIENAAEALGTRKGTIRVQGSLVADALDKTRAWVEIIVADDGPGVPPEVRDRIFDPDFSTKGSPKKLGFGLWWTKTLVQRLGGSIRLMSDGPGGAFNVRLPPIPAEEQPAP